MRELRDLQLNLSRLRDTSTRASLQTSTSTADSYTLCSVFRLNSILPCLPSPGSPDGLHTGSKSSQITVRSSVLLISAYRTELSTFLSRKERNNYFPIIPTAPSTSTRMPRAILYQPNTVKLCFLMNAINPLIISMLTANAVTIPMPRRMIS